MRRNEDVVDEDVHRSPATVRRTVSLIERGYRHESGIARQTLEAYADAFDEGRDFEFDPERFDTELEDADQHPHAGVSLAEEAAEMRDRALEDS